MRCHASSSSPSKVMKVLYCTGNAGKFREASFVIDGWNESHESSTVEYAQVDADPVEVQGTPEEIGASKVVEATRLLRERGAISPDVDWVVTEDTFDDGDCRNTCCAANENSCCETDFRFVAGVAGGLFVLIAICVAVCCVECRRRRALGRVVRKRAAPPVEAARV